MNTNTIALLLISVPLFVDDNVDEECEQFSNSKSSDSELLSICLNFYQFQPDVACKSVAYKNVVSFNWPLRSFLALLNVSFLCYMMSNIYMFVNMATQDKVSINDVANCFCEAV